MSSKIRGPKGPVCRKQSPPARAECRGRGHDGFPCVWLALRVRVYQNVYDVQAVLQLIVIDHSSWREEKMQLADKVCLITGGTRGIGAASAIDLAQRGADVALVGRVLDE